jgi:hypothetical protein
VVSTLELQYLCANTGATSQQMQPQFQIINHGTTAVPISSLTIRYFFTLDGNSATNLTFSCDYAQINSSNVSAVFNTWAGTNADEYIELHFAAGAGMLAAGQSTGPIQARFYESNYLTFTQTNDYSFDPTKTAFADWSHVTLYQSGTLVSGTEP